MYLAEEVTDLLTYSSLKGYHSRNSFLKYTFTRAKAHLFLQ